MVIDSNDKIIHMSTDEAETYETVPTGEDSPVEIDDDLAIVKKQTIFEKYGVHCDASISSFHESLQNQFDRNGRLSEKQINALRR